MECFSKHRHAVSHWILQVLDNKRHEGGDYSTLGEVGKQCPGAPRGPHGGARAWGPADAAAWPVS